MTMLPREEHERRMVLYRDGLNDREIADQVHVTTEAISAWRRTNGLPAHNQHRKVTPEMEAEMRKLHREGASDSQIAKEIGRCVSTIRSWRRRNGLPGNYGTGGKPTGKS